MSCSRGWFERAAADPALRAAALWHGGDFIEKRSPKETDKFYKALARRCAKLPIGKRAAHQALVMAGTVVVRGVDVVYPGRHGLAQHGNGGVRILRRPEHPRAGQLHRAVADPVDGGLGRGKCERPAQRCLAAGVPELYASEG